MEKSEIIQNIQNVKDEISKIEIELEKLNIKEIEGVHEEIRKLIRDLDKIIELFYENKGTIRVWRIFNDKVDIYLPFEVLAWIQFSVTHTTTVSDIIDMLKQGIFNRYPEIVKTTINILHNALIQVSSRYYIFESITSRVNDLKDRVSDLEKQIEELKEREDC